MPYPRPYRGLYKQDGDFAINGDVLVVQGTYNYHPGVNVTSQWEIRDLIIRADCDGKVYITNERCNLDYSHEDMENKYGWRKETTIFKTHIHVVPDPMKPVFNLVNNI